MEHVNDERMVIKEAIRVTKQNGYLYFFVPEFRQFYEGHYKMYLPLFLPKFILKMILVINRRPLNCLNTLRFITAKQLRYIFKSYDDITTMQVYWPSKDDTVGHSKFGDKVVKFIQDELGIEKNHKWLLYKK